MKPGHSYLFSHAIVREPGKSVAEGLRDMDEGDPLYDAFSKEHQSYVATLKSTGVTVIECDALEEFPDSVFVEDPALYVGGAAIILRPGAETRFGERDAAREVLSTALDRIIDLPAGGSVDGGDILVTEREVLAGLSARTNEAGLKLLEPIVNDLGMPLRMVVTPPEILHFKTECGLLDAETLFSTVALANTGCFDGYKVIECPVGEEAAANLIRFNDLVLVSAGFPKTAELLRSHGYSVVEQPTFEAAKIDGGLSCMSLRFSPA
jgi:dimethylargininase